MFYVCFFSLIGKAKTCNCLKEQYSVLSVGKSGKTDHTITLTNSVKGTGVVSLTGRFIRAMLKPRISIKTNIMKDENGRFIGFYSPKYTQVPDDLFDELMSELSGSELKVLLYVIRRTFGFKKDSDLISLSQMVSGIVKKDGTILDKGTGLSKEGVSKALKSLVEKGILMKNRKHSEKRGFKASEYALSIFNYPLSDNLTSPPSQNNRQALAQKSDIQETVKQDTDITLSKPVDNSEVLQKKELLGQILVTCRDFNSINFYRKVINEVPRFKILSALSEVKEAQTLGRVKKNAGAMFTNLITRDL